MRSLKAIKACLWIFFVVSIANFFSSSVFAGSGASCESLSVAPLPDTTRHVVHISVDGLRADALDRLGGAAPNFRRLEIEGTFTENARTDYDYTVTLPDHACQLTGRPVLGEYGHSVSFNSYDTRTIAEVHGSYVAGVFDVVHDNGMRTACYAGKSKFEIFDRSWNAANGAPDLVGEDDGRDKIDRFVYAPSQTVLFEDFAQRLASAHYHYAFVHFAEPDRIGHEYGWESYRYFAAIIEIDAFLGSLFDLVESDSSLAGRTWILLTTDHGGVETDHGDATLPGNYTIPLYVWGPGIPAGADLYELNPESRIDPGTGRPDHSLFPQPIRNGEAANIALDILGLGPVPASTFDRYQDLALAPTNGIPCVRICSPEPGATFSYPSDIEVTVEADGGSYGIEKVEFFMDGELLAVDCIAPYQHHLVAPPIGIRRITARAVRGDGVAAAASLEIEISSTAGTSSDNSSLQLIPRIYPNPAGGSGFLVFELERSQYISIEFYDPLGRILETLWKGDLEAGSRTISFDLRSYPPGIYFLTIAAGSSRKSEKLVLLR